MRSEARAFALQMLYQAAIYPEQAAGQIQAPYWQQAFFEDSDLYFPLHLFRQFFWGPPRSEEQTQTRYQDQMIEIKQYWADKQEPDYAAVELIDLFQRLFWKKVTDEREDEEPVEIEITVEASTTRNLLDKADGLSREFANLLVTGTLENLAQIDTTIESALIKWELRRLHLVDLSILRASVYEMLYLIDIPPIVSINEAIELAKKFGTDDSPRFINGVLDQVKKTSLDTVSQEFLRTSESSG